MRIVFVSELDEIAQLLQLDNQLLFNCLTRLGDHWDQLEPDGTEIDACYASRLKFTLCRTLYGRLFAWIVTRVNDALKLKPNPGTAGSGSRGKTIGLLDFYGFESLEKNSFDQLAINYCNERLQQVSGTCISTAVLVINTKHLSYRNHYFAYSISSRTF